MSKTGKIIACIAGGAALTIGSLVLADRYLGKNYLGSPTGKIVGRCFKNGKFYLYVKRFNHINEVEVDKDTCMSVQNGDYFDMASEGAYTETRRRAHPEEVLDSVPDEDELAEMLSEEPMCSCVGACNGEHICDEEDFEDALNEE
jgi:hypothetical protein